MLGKHERDRLAEIESALVSDDPRLAEKFDRFDGRWGWSELRKPLGYVLLAVLVVLVVLCFASGLTVTAVLLAFWTVAGSAGMWWHTRRNRHK